MLAFLFFGPVPATEAALMAFMRVKDKRATVLHCINSRITYNGR